MTEQEIFQSVTVAQLRSFARRMPAYYISVIAMMAAVILTYHHLAPLWLSWVIPGLAILLSGSRGIWWIKHVDDEPGYQQARSTLQRATRTLIVSALIVVTMDFALFRYGDAHTRYALILQMLASAMCGFYCLMHLRWAALAIAAIVFFPCCILMFSMHHASITTAGITALITFAVMVWTMSGYQQDFTSLVRSKAETSKLSNENLRLAGTDMLTGLPNRRYFFEMLDKLHHAARQQNHRIAVGLIDLDGFKAVNDTFGHRVGDTLLTQVAKRLDFVSPIALHLSRVGGDEFAFILVQVEDPASLIELGQDFVKSISESFRIGDRVTSVGCSLGFALSSPQDQKAEALYEQADYALYHAKRSGRARAVLFSEEHATLIREQGLVEQSLRNADLDAEFYLQFQPITHLRTNEILAFECLARWDSPLLGTVSPGVFIPIAEQAGIITLLTPVLLRKALAAAQSWPPGVRLSFNVSPYDIASRQNTSNLIAIILQSGFAPHRISIEFTESALLQNFTDTTLHMQMIRDIGAKVSLDDFGCGHSSLSYLHSLPLDTIKVDRSFIRDIVSRPSSKKIVRSLVNLCRDMNLTCVVEGVETTAQLEILEQLGASEIQGYIFARPMSCDRVLDYIQQTHPTASDSESKQVLV